MSRVRCVSPEPQVVSTPGGERAIAWVQNLANGGPPIDGRITFEQTGAREEHRGTTAGWRWRVTYMSARCSPVSSAWTTTTALMYEWSWEALHCGHSQGSTSSMARMPTMLRSQMPVTGTGSFI